VEDPDVLVRNALRKEDMQVAREGGHWGCKRGAGSGWGSREEEC
jgi:hypothetical protein